MTPEQLKVLHETPAIEDVLNELYSAGRNDENNSEREPQYVHTDEEIAEIEMRLIKTITETAVVSMQIELDQAEADRVKALQQLGKTKDYIKALQDHVKEFWDVLKPHLPSTLRQKLNAAFDRIEREGIS